MKFLNWIRNALGIAICLVISQAAIAQTSYKIGGNSVLNLKGTSSLRNWGMTTSVFTGTANFTVDSDNQLHSITGFSLNVPVRNLKSTSREIEKDAYKALKADQFENVSFALTSASFIASGYDHYLILLHGNLTMAGVTHATTLRASAAFNADGTISCSGSLPLSFSKYDMARPSFLLGTMKVNDAMTLDYSLLLVQ
ncbi:MAG TPA: YceI family protein [Candidatus Kapabacteria bacterium]|nr:YceI family protein [Candidatus Kapabacteria bacterium]